MAKLKKLYIGGQEGVARRGPAEESSEGAEREGAGGEHLEDSFLHDSKISPVCSSRSLPIMKLTHELKGWDGDVEGGQG